MKSSVDTLQELPSPPSRNGFWFALLTVKFSSRTLLPLATVGKLAALGRRTKTDVVCGQELTSETSKVVAA